VAVAVSLMMVQVNTVMFAHIVQLVADTRQQASAHDYSADGFGVGLPLNLVAFQAPPEDAHMLHRENPPITPERLREIISQQADK